MNIPDLTCPEDIRAAAITVLRTVPWLADLVYYIDGEDLAGAAVWDMVDNLSYELKHGDDSFFPLAANQVVDEVNEIVSELVSYNNDKWNFAPDCAPAKIPSACAHIAVYIVLTCDTQPYDIIVGPGTKPTTVLTVRQRKANKFELTEWSMDEGWSVGNKILSRHTSKSAALKALGLILSPPCIHIFDEEYAGSKWCTKCGDAEVTKGKKKK